MSSVNRFGESRARACSLRAACLGLIAALVLSFAGPLHAAAVSLTVNLTDSTTGQPRANTQVQVYLVMPTGLISRLNINPGSTNAAGTIVLALDNARTYYLKAAGTNGVFTRTTNFMPVTGVMNLVVGGQAIVEPTSGTSTTSSGTGSATPPPPTTSTGGNTSAAIVTATITLRDAQTNAVMPGQSVYVFRKDATGDVRLPGMPMVTNGSGQIAVTGIDTTNTNKYYAKVRAYNARWSSSQTFPSSGTTTNFSVNFLVGSTAVRVVDATNPSSPTGIADLRVTLQDNTGESWRSLEILRTDADGWLRVDLDGIATGKEYRFSADYGSPTPVTVNQNPMSLPGVYTFAVAGELPLPALTARQKAYHLINRITFGMTPQLYDQLSVMNDAQLDAWRAQFVAQQLDAYNIEDSQVEIYIKNFTGDPADPVYGSGGGYATAPASSWTRDQNHPMPFAAWVNNRNYNVGDEVSYDPDGGGANQRGYFKCKVAHLSVTADNQPYNGTNWATYWDSLSPPWASGTVYKINDVVRHKHAADTIDRIYYCRQNHTASAANEPVSAGNTQWTASTNGNMGLIRASVDQAKQTYTRRMIRSNRQLLEKLTFFWDNHFSTDENVNDRGFGELHETNTFRSHALGPFRQLMTDCAKSAQMVNYLNSVQNVKNSPNENFAREIMELHTMSVDGGYTQEDIVNAARAFTGWRDDNITTSPTYIYTLTPGFRFDAGQHDYGPNTPLTTSKNGGIWKTGISYSVGDVTIAPDGKRYAAKVLHTSDALSQPPNVTYWNPRTNIVVLGNVLANYPNNSAAAVARGEQVIDICCRHPSTARFITKKLCNLLVSDTPSQEILDAAASTFANTDGDIKQVVTTILNHPDFYNPKYYRNKIKTPIEFLVGIARNFTLDPAYPAYNSGTFPAHGDIITSARLAAMNLYEYPEPTGWSELGSDWLGTNMLLYCYRHGGEASFVDRIGISTASNPVRAWMTTTNDARLPNKTTAYTSKDQIINYLVGLGNNGEMSGYELNYYRLVIDKYNSTNFSINNTNGSTADNQIKSVINAIINSPGYLNQ